MPCDRVVDLLERFVDGELSARLADRVAAHLAVCEACRKERAVLGALRSLLRETLPVSAPAGLWDRIEAAARGPVVREASRPGGIRWLPRVAAAVAGAMLVLGAHRLLVPAPRPASPGVEVPWSAAPDSLDAVVWEARPTALRRAVEGAGEPLVRRRPEEEVIAWVLGGRSGR